MSVSAASTGAAAAATSQDVGQGDLFIALVPDGIRSVVLHFADGTSVKAPVTSNAFEVATTTPASVSSVAWTDAAGVTHVKETPS
jgi:hypothetical protein